MSPVVIRLAGLSDLPVLAPLFDSYRQFYEQRPDTELAMRYLEERLRKAESVVLLAEDNHGSAVGFCLLYPSFCSVEAGPIYTLSDLFVTPAVRRTGVGRELLRAAEREAASAGKVRMDLTTARSNLRAQALYESLGWTRDEVFHAYNLRIRP